MTNPSPPSYFERLSNTESQNTHLKCLTAGLLALCLLLTAGWYFAQRKRDAVQPFVVSVDEAGKWHVKAGQTGDTYAAW
jgi:hypothetical protein